MVNPSPDREDKAATPILPAHIEDTVRAIAGLHWEHHRKAKPVQRTVARMTSAIGRPRFVGLLTLAILSWISLNLILPALGRASLDPPPFAYLQDAAGILSLYITSLILITQRHDEQLAEHRAQLTLELAIVSEQKNSKIIALLEEMRRDHPHISDRIDDEAEAMARPSDPQVVLDAIKDTHGDLLSADEQITPA
ncbi:hypothetical protein ME121_4907 [Methylobacterium sp. ME121]|jgi:uncharacterized membrane protein|nr:hypothetical protein ME121_4907 [Methylobacterium sp. ME121]